MIPTSEFYAALGSRLQKIRKKKGISLRALQDMLGGKYGASTLSRYERGDPNIADALDDICDALGVDANEIWEETASKLSFRKMAGDILEEEKVRKYQTLKEYYDDETIEVADEFSQLPTEKRGKVKSYIGFVKSEK